MKPQRIPWVIEKVRGIRIIVKNAGSPSSILVKLIWPVTNPAAVIVHQSLTGVTRHQAKRLADVRGELQVQHLVDEHAEEVVERGCVRTARGIACGRRA